MVIGGLDMILANPQDTARVTHRHSVADLKGMGSELERTVLARAVTWHLQDRVIVYGNKTVVFR